MSRLLIKLIGLNQVYRSLKFRSMGTTNTASTKVAAAANATKNNNNDIDNNKASPDQLAQLEQRLVIHLPTLFTAPHQYNLYTKDLLFVDNIRNLRVQGIGAYAMQVALIKIYYHTNYSSNKLELLNLVKNPEESYIRIRWRVVSKPGLVRFILFFWKFRSSEVWRDGISTMHVNKDGLIYCHICDNIDVETDDVTAKQKLNKYYYHS